MFIYNLFTNPYITREKLFFTCCFFFDIFGQSPKIQYNVGCFLIKLKILNKV